MNLIAEPYLWIELKYLQLLRTVISGWIMAPNAKRDNWKIMNGISLGQHICFGAFVYEYSTNFVLIRPNLTVAKMVGLE